MLSSHRNTADFRRFFFVCISGILIYFLYHLNIPVRILFPEADQNIPEQFCSDFMLFERFPEVVSYLTSPPVF
ncbi:MAG: hypothetical protein IJJ69_11290 [Oscillospiraceae bacterium]|nr:hypothetical protein [Oscillospiraceae bacterium]